ncbi:MAG: DNA-binding response regulator [Actinobacteria bacterium]|nr:DNA-binding response regulator [Actinomycetota bacterium]
MVALVPDLMDRSRVTAALPDVEFVSDPTAVAGADVIVVDLARHAGDVAAIRAAAPEARVIAFGPHVDDAMLTDASADGADVVMPRSRFFRDPSDALRGP